MSTVTYMVISMVSFPVLIGYVFVRLAFPSRRRPKPGTAVQPPLTRGVPTWVIVLLILLVLPGVVLALIISRLFSGG
ncbi:MAG: hypothetical protein B7W96_00150 [Parcubacteria group bacterium 37-58-5]|nr:MAG: hypothetical protein B7X03_00505 [Parcubacteria group bacterium 21-58-10]OYV83256.1 MAG: hypothetical protein B7W96_00150 [Parcubacteria group bacterium 37-58-5]